MGIIIKGIKKVVDRIADQKRKKFREDPEIRKIVDGYYKTAREDAKKKKKKRRGNN